MYISKKELLVATEISYGQLYRWKREKLIPEEWFIKQSSYTGQETVFPKQQILTRIKFIKNMKDEYSLEEIANMLEKESTAKEISLDEVDVLEYISDEIVELYKKDEYSYSEVAMLKIMSTIKKENELEKDVMKGLIEGISEEFEKMQKKEQVYTLLSSGEKFYGIISNSNEELKVDKRLDKVEKFFIDEIIGSIRLDIEGGMESYE